MYKTLLLTIAGTLALTNLQAQNIDPFKPDFSLPAAVKEGYRLVWNDEFNTNGKPAAANWEFEHGFVRNEELQWYQENNAVCTNGVLLIEGRRERIRNIHYDSTSTDWHFKTPFAEYTSASINTRGHWAWLFGSFEIRARIDTTKGAWPAIWTLGSQGEWPLNGEIDIMEFYRVKDTPTILANVAWGTEKRFVARWNTKMISLNNFTDKDPNWVKKFHTWRMDWSAAAIKLYLDDELLNETLLTGTINPDGSNPFSRPQYLLLNLALGRNGGDPAGSKMPVKYEVDYVRVYQKN